MNINLKPALRRISALTGSMLLLMQMALPMSALATAQEVCPDTGGGWVKVDGLSSTSYTYTVPEGYTVTDNCYKSSNSVIYGSGNVVTSTVFNSPGGAVCTAPGVPHNGCAYQNLSHASFKLVAVPKGSITIVKNAIPDSPQNFNFTSNISGYETFQLDDESGANTDSVPESVTISDLSAGTYNFAELATRGWNLDSISCPDINETKNVSAGTLSLTITAGQDVTCTFTNRPVGVETGSITIIKDADPNDVQDFSFTTTGTGLSAFELDDDGETTNKSNTKVFNALQAGTYSVTEAEATGWNLDDIECDTTSGVTVSLANRKVTIVLAEGVDVVCTFVNEKENVEDRKVTICHRTNSVTNPYRRISVSVNAVDGDGNNDHFGQHDEPYVPQNEAEAQALKDAKQKWGDIIKPFGEHPGLNWELGQEIYENDCKYVPQEEKGNLTIRKQVNGGAAQDFEFETEWNEGSFFLDDDNDDTLSDRETFTRLSAGDYTVTEVLESGWELRSINCGNADVDVEGTSVTVHLEAGQDVTCVFRNRMTRVAPAKVTICHRTNSVTNPYRKITVSVNAVDGVGGGDHYGQHKGPLAYSEERARELKDAKIKWGDIIPPVPGAHGGLNWTADGQAMFRNDCKYVSSEEEPELGDVSGFKFHDENSNGMRDSGEDKLSGWTIRLWHCVESEMPTMLLNRNSVQSQNDCDYEQVDTDVTNKNGAYSFNNLDEGWYKVCEVNKVGWTQTHPSTDDGCHEFEVTSVGESHNNKNFGNKKNPGRVLGVVTPDTPEVLVNTGTPLLQGILVGMTILGAAAGITALSRRKSYETPSF